MSTANPPDSDTPHAAGAPQPEAWPEALVVVRLGAAEFGLPIARVREVLRAPRLTRVPFPPPAVCGATAVRGAVVPVMDLGLRLLGRAAVRPGALVVVEEPATGEPLGLLVDGVSALLQPAQAEAREPPAEAEATLPAGWVAAVLVTNDGRVVTALHLEAVIAHVAPGGAQAPTETRNPARESG